MYQMRIKPETRLIKLPRPVECATTQSLNNHVFDVLPKKEVLVLLVIDWLWKFNKERQEKLQSINKKNIWIFD